MIQTWISSCKTELTLVHLHLHFDLFFVFLQTNIIRKGQILLLVFKAYFVFWFIIIEEVSPYTFNLHLLLS